MIALIVLGVIAFLAVDAYILWRVLGSGSRKGEHGSVPAPGEATISLPEGTTKLIYQETRKAPADTDGIVDFNVPTGLEVSVTPAWGGEPLEVRRGGRSYTGATSGWRTRGEPRSWTTIGRVEVPAAGEYLVVANGDLPDAAEPTVLLGR